MRYLKTINSVSEYLEHLQTIEKMPISTSTVGCFTLFRGQANSNWDLIPSLYRENLFKVESLMLTELKHICPNEFGENRFDNLVKLQHYGMPTRLLDTTTNPLVALYFACESESEMDKDGVVYIFPNMPVSWSTDALIELIMDYVYEYYPCGLHLEKMLEVSKEKYKNVTHRLMPEDIHALLHYLTIPAFAVMPSKSNDRVEAQDGAFLICGMKLLNYEISDNPGTLGRVYYNFDPIDKIVPEKISLKAEKLIIPAKEKKNILSQLDTLGINGAKLFPDLSHQIKHLVNSLNDHMLKK